RPVRGTESRRAGPRPTFLRGQAPGRPTPGACRSRRIPAPTTAGAAPGRPRPWPACTTAATRTVPHAPPPRPPSASPREPSSSQLRLHVRATCALAQGEDDQHGSEGQYLAVRGAELVPQVGAARDP